MKGSKMYEWHKNMQTIVDEIDICIKRSPDTETSGRQAWVFGILLFKEIQ